MSDAKTQHCHPTPCDCDDIIIRAHEIMTEAIESFDMGDKLIEEDLKQTLCYALEIVKCSLAYKRRAWALEEQAVQMLDYCEAYCPYAKNKEKCKPLLIKAEENFREENWIDRMIEDLLKFLLCKIEQYEEFDAKGDKFFAEYIACLHQNCGPC